MKKLTVLFSAALVAIALFAFTVPISYEVKVQDSQLKWTGKKIGGSHWGTISLLDGTLDFNDNKLYGGSFGIDMRTITNMDLKDDDTNAKLVGHLKSGDFFNVEEFPRADFVITNVKDGTDGADYLITGDLTIKGISNSVSFPATLESSKDVVTATATIVFDRSKYDVRYGSKSFFDNIGDKIIYDDIEMEVKIIAGR